MHRVIYLLVIDVKAYRHREYCTLPDGEHDIDYIGNTMLLGRNLVLPTTPFFRGVWRAIVRFDYIDERLTKISLPKTKR